MPVRTANILAAIAGLSVLCVTSEVLAQSAGGSCSTSGQTFTIGTNPTQTLVCKSGTWGVAEQINSNGYVGIGTSSTPQAQLDVNGGVRVGTDTSCTSSNPGEIIYVSTPYGTCSGSTSTSTAGLCYCNGTNWILLSSATSTNTGCGQSGSIKGGQSQQLTIQSGCIVTFTAWGAGGGGGGVGAGSNSLAPSGGGGGSATITLGPLSSATTYYIAVGGGGSGGSASNYGAAGVGGTALSGYNGGNGSAGGGNSDGGGGGGGGATGVWTGSYSGTPVIIAAGGAGGNGISSNLGSVTPGKAGGQTDPGTGTASQSGTTVTGYSSGWTSGTAGYNIVYTGANNGTVTGLITTENTATNLTVTNSQTIPQQTYVFTMPTSQGQAATTSGANPGNGGGGGGYLGGAYSYGGYSYAATGGGTTPGSGATPGSTGSTGYPSGYGIGGAGGDYNYYGSYAGSNGADGALYWSTN